MDCVVGIDLGSTTTKAVFMDTASRVVGHGITNSRSNYALACQIAREEGEINARSSILKKSICETPALKAVALGLVDWLSAKFALGHHLKQLEALESASLKIAGDFREDRGVLPVALADIFASMRNNAEASFKPGTDALSDFFRDLSGSLFLKEAEHAAKRYHLVFERLAGIFDGAIFLVENQSFAGFYREYLRFACREVLRMETFKLHGHALQAVVDENLGLVFNVLKSVGTGYGRLTLPFPKERIRSEILCHGLGAHNMFPLTRTILDIGGQDTKAIQVDENGVVTSFQMNDRCAAGCGRYLGYIADEMNMGVHQIGSMALTSSKPVKINSTCTVFAGAELRERLALGEKREDILAGLHRAIILRAMSLLARSGGIRPEFTFVGGVAKNEAAVTVLRELVTENYGEVPMNISPDSIFTGAIGAALFAGRDAA